MRVLQAKRIDCAPYFECIGCQVIPGIKLKMALESVSVKSFRKLSNYRGEKAKWSLKKVDQPNW